jgi:hypothetical protein
MVGSNVQKNPPGTGRGATTGPPESVHGPVGVGAVATPMAESSPGLIVVSVTVKYSRYRPSR